LVFKEIGSWEDRGGKIIGLMKSSILSTQRYTNIGIHSVATSNINLAPVKK
jgi:hypothetical protein